jgi:pimeloyl-ACP methyl ester carboxylesterase
MPQITANGLNLEYQLDGDASKPCVLLIMGLGMQLIAWPEALVTSIVQAGYCVLRLDNRDIGLSQKIPVKPPNLLWAGLKHRFGLEVQAPYKLRHMVDDTAALLAALKIDKVHVVGVSMGGMIAQGLAAHHPQLVLTLTSIMSSSGARHLPQAKARITRALLSRPQVAPDSPEHIAAIVAHGTKLFKLIGSPAYPQIDGVLATRIEAGLKRCYHPSGVARQMLAIVASGDRSAELAKITAPTLVLHGQDDPLVPLAHGQDSARKIKGSKLQVLPGMGHDLPPGVVSWLSGALLPHIAAHSAH